MITLDKQKAKYAKYKPTGIDWIGEIPVDWKSIRSRFVMQYKKWKNLKISSDIREDESFLPYLSMDILRWKEDCKIEYAKLDESLVETQEGDLLLLRDGSNAWEFMKSKDWILSSTMAKFSLLRKENSQYLYYLSKFFEPVLKEFSIWMGIPHVNWNVLKDLTYFQFDTKEQQIIADYLDDKTALIDNIISLKNKQIDLLKERRASLIHNAVTKGLNPNVEMINSWFEVVWKMPRGRKFGKLKYLSKIANSNIDKKSEDDIPVLLCNYVDVYKNDFITDKIEFMKATATSIQYEKFKLQVWDVIITKDSETANDIWIPAYVKGTLDNLVCWYHLTLCRSNKELLWQYLFYYLHNKKIRDYYEFNANWVTRFWLWLNTITSTPIIYPSFGEQEAIVAFLDSKTVQIDKTIEIVKKTIGLLTEYKQSLISNVVTGKVKVF